MRQGMYLPESTSYLLDHTRKRMRNNRKMASMSNTCFPYHLSPKQLHQLCHLYLLPICMWCVVLPVDGVLYFLYTLLSFPVNHLPFPLTPVQPSALLHGRSSLVIILSKRRKRHNRQTPLSQVPKGGKGATGRPRYPKCQKAQPVDITIPSDKKGKRHTWQV